MTALGGPVVPKYHIIYNIMSLKHINTYMISVLTEENISKRNSGLVKYQNTYIILVFTGGVYQSGTMAW